MFTEIKQVVRSTLYSEAKDFVENLLKFSTEEEIRISKINFTT